jgi:hypothetical protein
MPKAPTPLQLHEARVIREAVAFRAIAFRGRGEYVRRDAPTLDEARRVAGEIKTDRPVGVYAVDADGRSTHVENV